MSKMKRRVAFAMALTMMMTSLPVNGMVGYAEEYPAEVTEIVANEEDSTETEEVAEETELGEEILEEEPDIVEEEIVEESTEGEVVEETEQLLMVQEEQTAAEAEVYANSRKSIYSVSEVDVKEEFWKEIDDCVIERIFFCVNYADGTYEDVNVAGAMADEGYNLIDGGHIDFILSDLTGNPYKIGEELPVGNYSLWMKDCNKTQYHMADISVQSIAENVKATWTETGSVTIDSKEDEYVWYQFTAPEDGKYWVRDGEPDIYKKEGDEWKSVESMDAAKGDKYYLGYSWGFEDEDGNYCLSWTTELEKVKAIESVQNIQLKKDTFVADADFGYLLGAQIKVVYGEEAKQLTFTTQEDDEKKLAYVDDGEGNRIYAYLINENEEEIAANKPQKAGEYTLCFKVDGKKISGNCTITVKDITEMQLSDLNDNSTISTKDASYHLSSWYQFTAQKTGRYQIGGNEGYKIYKKNEEGNLVQVNKIGERLFSTQEGQIYYLGFWGSLDDDESIYEGKIHITYVSGIKTISVNAASNTYLENAYIQLRQNVLITYEDGSNETVPLDNWDRDSDDNTYVLDSRGNTILLFIQKEGEKDKNPFYSYLDAGQYTIYLQWAENPAVEAHFDITVKKLTTPATDSSISVITMEPGRKYQVELNENRLEAWFRYTAQADCEISFKSEKNTGESYDTYGEIYDENSELLCENDDDEDENFNLVYKLQAGKTYYLRSRMYYAGAYGNFLVSLNLKAHIHNYTEDRKNATCTQPGYQQQKCSICGEVKQGSYATLPITAHSFGAWEVATQPTALTTGVQTHTCSVCGYKENAEITKLTANVTLSANTIPLQLKQSVSLSKLITGMTAGDSLVSCTTSNKKIATVNNTGKVTGKKAGSAKITMNFASGISKKVTVKVQKKKVAASKITNVPGSITLEKKKTYKLTPVITPITTKDKATYKTANKKIATVSGKGTITAKKAGKTTITIKVGKKTKKVKVTVK